MIPPPVTDAVVMTLGAAADEASTHVALSRCAGCREVGPFRHPAARVGAKSLVLAGSVVAAHELRKSGHGRAAKVLRWTVFALYVGVAAHNMKVSR